MVGTLHCTAVEGKDNSFTHDGGQTNIMVKSVQYHHRVYHRDDVSKVAGVVRPSVLPSSARPPVRPPASCDLVTRLFGFGVGVFGVGQLCKDFVAGDCKKGDDCKFVHRDNKQESGTASNPQAHGQEVLQNQRAAYMEIAYENSRRITAPFRAFKADLAATDRAMRRINKNSVLPFEDKRHHGAAAAACRCFSDLLKADQLERLKKSPVIGVAVDESTDVAVQSNMPIYIYYIHNGKCRVEFFELVALEGGSAEDLLQVRSCPLVVRMVRKCAQALFMLAMLGDQGVLGLARPWIAGKASCTWERRMYHHDGC